MVGRVWLIGLLLLPGCVIAPARPVVAVGVPPPRPYVTACRDPSATLLRLDNPGPGPTVVGRTLVWPGRTALCVPAGARRLVAMQVAPAAPGQPPRPVVTPDQRAIVGHPIAIVMRGPRLAVGTIDWRYVVPLPMRFAGLAGAPPPGPPDGGPPGSGPPGRRPDLPPGGGPPGASSQPPEDSDTTDSLYEASRGVELPAQDEGIRRPDSSAPQ
jgi:hypothetical protein